MEQMTTACDQCGTIKSDVNHWFIASLGLPSGQLVLEGDNQTEANKGVRHICGSACLTKEVAGWAMKTAAESPAPETTASTEPDSEYIPWPFTLADIAVE